MVHTLPEMGNNFNGNGNSNGTHNLVRQLSGKVVRAKPTTSPHAIKESKVTFITVEGVKLHGMPVRVTRHIAVFELYNPSVTPRFSEALKEFEIISQAGMVYSGGATVRNVLDAGTKIICEVTLWESDWADLNPEIALQRDSITAKEFTYFLNDWQKIYKVQPEFKVIVADMQTFLHDLRLWMERVELKIRVFPKPIQAELEGKTIAELAPPIIDAIDGFINQFESIVSKLDADAHPGHCAYLRRQLHPLILLSPFAHRAFEKPLGYAGDYLIVDMMMRSPIEGSTLFAKIINVWLLGQSPAQAHRNRVAVLEDKLIQETARVRASGRIAKIYNLGCGPAAEVQRFFSKQHICGNANLKLVDFNEETLQYLKTKLDDLSLKVSIPASYHFVKKSVNQILKDALRAPSHSSEEKYDYIYCAGLFDYFPDNICKQLINNFYQMLAPAGLFLATNATEAMNSSRPFRYSMEYILDWHLFYRNKNQFAELSSDLADLNDIKIVAEDTGANLFLEVKKPNNA
jgi:extracellular factor (EF) 3-hydroxypalmitic acid methyl ester biosynthesis protein